ncbi:hypothetical protein G3A39_39945 [Paraburkholderia aspalathi]|nr:hypothetical protein [Paraburkholderia aspalathi]
MAAFEHRKFPAHLKREGYAADVDEKLQQIPVKCFHYDSHDQLRTHHDDCMAAYNFAHRLKTLIGLIPYEYICKF